jgi:hypothetical protein
MAPIAISFLAFVLALVGILLGSVMQRLLPEGHLSSDSKEVVKLSMGVVATLAALVLGLLVASAKGTYDAREKRTLSSVRVMSVLSLKADLRQREHVRYLPRSDTSQIRHARWRSLGIQSFVLISG